MPEFLFNKVADLLEKKEAPAQLISKFCKIIKNTFIIEELCATTSIYIYIYFQNNLSGLSTKHCNRLGRSKATSIQKYKTNLTFYI